VAVERIDDLLWKRVYSIDAFKGYYQMAALYMRYQLHGASGPIIRAAALALEQAGEERSTWYYMLPGTQQC
jgi:hypothetical protein